MLAIVPQPDIDMQQSAASTRLITKYRKFAEIDVDVDEGKVIAAYNELKQGKQAMHV